MLSPRSPHSDTSSGHGLFFQFCLKSLLLLSALLIFANPGQILARTQVTLLIPASPDISIPKQPKDKKDSQAQKNKQSQDKSETPQQPGNIPSINEETDVLITRMDAFAHAGIAMDMPQAFTVLSFDHTSPVKDGHLQAERRDLLGDVEEILYMGQRAWGANVGLVRPGLYQFIMQTRPWWEEKLSRYQQHYVKVMMPVYGEDAGWYEPAGLRFEIVPLTRPFGLLSPCSFSGRVLFEGRPLPDVNVSLMRINTDGQKVPTAWHEYAKARTDAAGQFNFVPNRTGWWTCMATIEGSPLKGADGQPRPLTLGSLFWFYVDSESGTAR